MPRYPGPPPGPPPLVRIRRRWHVRRHDPATLAVLSLVLALVCIILLLDGGDIAIVIVTADDATTVELPVNMIIDELSDPMVSNIIVPYQIANPDVSLSRTLDIGDAPRIGVIQGTADFAVSTTGFTASELAARPTLAQVPCMAAAIVPVYHLRAIQDAMVPLTFSLDVLAAIFYGEISRWNDPQLVALNPAVRLPNSTIVVVVQTTGNAINRVFTNALASARAATSNTSSSSSFRITPSESPAWPYSRYLRYRNSTSVHASVFTQIEDGSISYAPLSVAQDVDISIGRMVHRGVVLDATADAIDTTLNEQLTATVADLTLTRAQLLALPSSSRPLDIDVTNPTSTLGWPMVMLSYLQLDTQINRSTCQSRAHMVDLWLWWFLSDASHTLADTNGVSIMPAIVREHLGVVAWLQSRVFCDGLVMFSPPVTTEINIAMNSRLSGISSLLIDVYTSTVPSSQINTYLNDGGISLQRLLAHELHGAFVFSEDIDDDPAWPLVTKADSDFIMVPIALAQILPFYNIKFPTADLNTAESIDLRVSLSLLARIFSGNVTNWADAELLAYNPQLTQLFDVRNPPSLRRVKSCFGTSPASSFHLMTWNIEQLDPSAVLDDPVFDQHLAGCRSSEDDARLILTVNEFTVHAIIHVLPGTVGHRQADDGDPVATFSIVGRSSTPPGLASSFASVTPTTPSTIDVGPTNAAMWSCVYGRFNLTSAYFHNDIAPPPDCWPFHQAVWFIVRKSYVGPDDCMIGLNALSFVDWLVTSDALDDVLQSQSLLRMSADSAIRESIRQALFRATCDGESLLTDVPSVWQVPSSLKGFGVGASALGIVACLLSIAFVVRERETAVVRSASPLFFTLSLLGLMLIFASTLVWSLQPSNATCAAFSWLANFGFTCTFAPLFAKTWRIFRIFGGRKLRVVKITNARLFVMVCVLLAYEMVTMSVWQAIAPLHAISVVEKGGVAPYTWVRYYPQCGLDSTAYPSDSKGRVLFLIVLLSKCALMVFGAVMAFSTRKVVDRFNESTTIAWSLLNVLFACIAGVPMLALMNARSETLLIAVLLLGLWAAFFTLALLMVPKLLVVLHVKLDLFGHGGGGGGGMDGKSETNTISAGGGSQFSFIDVKQFKTDESLQAYVGALEKHLEQVRQIAGKTGGKRSGAPAITAASAASAVVGDSRRVSVVASLITKPPAMVGGGGGGAIHVNGGGGTSSSGGGGGGGGGGGATLATAVTKSSISQGVVSAALGDVHHAAHFVLQAHRDSLTAAAHSNSSGAVAGQAHSNGHSQQQQQQRQQQSHHHDRNERIASSENDSSLGDIEDYGDSATPLLPGAKLPYGAIGPIEGAGAASGGVQVDVFVHPFAPGSAAARAAENQVVMLAAQQSAAAVATSNGGGTSNGSAASVASGGGATAGISLVRRPSQASSAVGGGGAGGGGAGGGGIVSTVHTNGWTSANHTSRVSSGGATASASTSSALNSPSSSLSMPAPTAASLFGAASAGTAMATADAVNTAVTSMATTVTTTTTTTTTTSGGAGDGSAADVTTGSSVRRDSTMAATVVTSGGNFLAEGGASASSIVGLSVSSSTVGLVESSAHQLQAQHGQQGQQGQPPASRDPSGPRHRSTYSMSTKVAFAQLGGVAALGTTATAADEMLPTQEVGRRKTLNASARRVSGATASGLGGGGGGGGGGGNSVATTALLPPS